MDQRASRAGGQSGRAGNQAVIAKGQSSKAPQQKAASQQKAAPPKALKAPSPTPPRTKSVHPTRELPAPTPLVLPARSVSTPPPAPSAAKGVMGKPSTSKAPPPPQRRRASTANASVLQAGASATAMESVPQGGELSRTASRTEQQRLEQQRLEQQWEQHPDADWAQHLSAQSAPESEAPNSPHAAPDSQPPGAPSNLLDLESEISALRPRPSELPPAPAGHSERVPTNRRSRETNPYRTKTPSDLSVLFQGSAVNSPVAKRAEVGARPLVQPGSRGYLPKSPLEFLPPPPPPTRRAHDREFGAFSDASDDEMPTQARRPASVPPVARVTGHRSAIVPPPAPAAPPVAERPGMRLPSSLPAAAFGGVLPQLPPPPALPAGMERAVRDASSYESWEDQEWTGAHAADLRVPALRGGAIAPNTAPDSTPPGVHDSNRPSANPMHAAQYVTPDSVRPTALSVPPGAGGFLPTGWLPVAGASVMGAALSAGAFMLPQRGQLLVDVSNQSWASLGSVQIFVDGELVCTQSPCAVKLDAESHLVKAVAPGYQSSQEDSVLITDDSVTLHKIQLGASADTGIDVQTTVPNLQLYVDGRRVGSLPRKVMGLPPGEHTVVVSGGEHFTSEERRVMVEPNQILAISDLTPKLKAGSLEVSVGANADGASVLLDGKNIALPYKAHLTPGQTYRLSAHRDGYEAFEKTFVVDANNPSATIDVALAPLPREEAVIDADEPARRGRASRSRYAPRMTRAQAVAKALGEDPTETSAAPVQAESTSSNGLLGAAMRQSVGLPAETPSAADKGADSATDTKATGKGFLNIVTTPSALVVIDGKPMGKTPRRVAVSAGKHSVVLVHANGRKRTAVDIDAGGTKTIKASF